MTVQQLQGLAVLLNLERSGEKSALAVRISEYIRSPKDLGASKPAPRKSTTSTKKKSAAVKSGKKKAVAAKKKTATKPKKAAAAAKNQTQPKKEKISEAAIHTDSEDEKIIAEVTKEVGGHGHRH